MKALSLTQPWASAIADGVKLWETRSWSTKHRGPLAICSTKAAPEQPLIYGRGKPMPRGFVLAVVDLVDVLPIRGWGVAGEESVVYHGDGRLDHFVPSDRWLERHEAPDDEAAVALITDVSDQWAAVALITDVSDQYPWGDWTPGRYAWRLENIRPLPEPVPVTGRQGLFALPADVAEILSPAS
jgi:hypothetical protein